MKKLLVLLFILPFSLLAQKELAVKNTTIRFLFVSQKTKGTLSSATVRLNLDSEDISKSTITGSVPVETLTTDNKLRDKHLKSKDFFDVENYPIMTFEGTSMTEDEVVGNLTIKGVTKEVTFNMKDAKSDIILSTTIYTSDFGISVKKSKEKNEVRVTVIISSN